MTKPARPQSAASDEFAQPGPRALSRARTKAVQPLADAMQADTAATLPPLVRLPNGPLSSAWIARTVRRGRPK